MSEWDERAQSLLAEGSNAWDRGNRLQAEKLFRQVVQEFPNRPEGYNKVGVIFAETGQLQEAEQYFLMALTQDRSYAPALTNLGNILLERGQTDEAIQHYLLALQSDPDYPAAHRNLGVAYRRQGKYNSYVTHFKRSQKLDDRRVRDEMRRRRVTGGGRSTPAAGPRIPTFVWLILAAIGAVILLTVFRR